MPLWEGSSVPREPPVIPEFNTSDGDVNICVEKKPSERTEQVTDGLYVEQGTTGKVGVWLKMKERPPRLNLEA